MNASSCRPRSARAALWLAGAVAALVATAPQVQAQVFMTAQPVPLPSAYPSDWGSTHSLCRILMSNQAGEPVRCDLRVRIGSGADTGNVVVPRQFNVGPTFLTTPEVTNWSQLVLRGSLKDAYDRTGHLPARPITITVFCENMTGLVTGQVIPPVQETITIVPSIPPPPTLLTPADASHIRVSNPVFSWTPARLTTGGEVWYQFRLVKVLGGQTPARALDANYPVIETFVHQSTFVYPSDAPRLEDGALYAWRVQALLNARTDTADPPAAGSFANVGLNEGRSRVYAFVWETPLRSEDAASAAAPGRAVPGASNGLLQLGAEDHAPPAAPRSETRSRVAVTPADSLALALFHPTRDVWPRVPGGPVFPPDRPTTRGEGAGIEGTPGMVDTSGTPGAGAQMPVAGADGVPMRTPMDIELGVPQGEGLSSKWLRVSGTSIAAGEWYSHSGAGTPSRPDNTGQVMAGMTLSTFNNKVNIPLQFLISGDRATFRQNVNQFALHPRFRWGALHAGNISPGYSSFSLADATLLGGGADVARGNWYAGFVNGRAQKAIHSDLINPVEARYERNVIAGRLGYGSPFGNAIEVNVMRARDDAGSLPAADSLVHVAPAQGWVFGGRARHTVLDTCTTLQLEGAWSRFDRSIDTDLPTINGGAGGVRLQRLTALGEVGAALDYIGGGFVTLANSELTPDRVEGRLDGRRDLMAGKLRIGGNLGFRRDDLSGTLGGTTRRRSYGAQVGWQPVALFATDLDLGVLASRSPATDEREEFKDRTTSVTVSPRMMWQWRGAAQALSTSYSLQESEFDGAGAAGIPGSRSTGVVASFQTGVGAGLFVDLSGNYVETKTADITSRVSSFGPGLSLTLFGGRAQASSQVQWTETRISGFGTDHDLAPNLDVRYLVTGRQMFVFRAGVRRFRTGAAGLGNFEESRATLQYSASL